VHLAKNGFYGIGFAFCEELSEHPQSPFNIPAPLRARLKITWAFAVEYSGLIIMLFVRSPPRRITSEQCDKRPEERQPLGTGIQTFVFCVASPFTDARYAQGLRLKYKRLYFPSNAQVIFNRALIRFRSSHEDYKSYVFFST
jgi:hypothetical protein